MDNWIAHTLLLMLNIDFLSGFPDLNSFFPFEMEEDFLFALGHRFEPTHHAQEIHWQTDNFGINKNKPANYKQRLSILDQWLQELTTNQIQAHSLPVDTTTPQTIYKSISTTESNFLNTLFNTNSDYSIKDIIKRTRKSSNSNPIDHFNNDNIHHSLLTERNENKFQSVSIPKDIINSQQFLPTTISHHNIATNPSIENINYDRKSIVVPVSKLPISSETTSDQQRVVVPVPKLAISSETTSGRQSVVVPVPKLPISSETNSGRQSVVVPVPKLPISSETNSGRQSVVVPVSKLSISSESNSDRQSGVVQVATLSISQESNRKTNVSTVLNYTIETETLSPHLNRSKSISPVTKLPHAVSAFSRNRNNSSVIKLTNSTNTISRFDPNTSGFPIIYQPIVTESTSLSDTTKTTPTTSTRPKPGNKFRDDMKIIFEEVSTTTQNPGQVKRPISKRTKEYRPATVEFRPLTDIYKTVTTSYGDLLDGTNSDKTRSMVGAQNGGNILNIEKNSPSDTFLLGGINYNNQNINVDSFASHATTQWPYYVGVTSKPRDMFVKLAVSIPLKKSLGSHPAVLKLSSSESSGIPINLSFISPDSVPVQKKADLSVHDGQLNTPLTSISAKGACDGCKMENGAGYNRFPGECDTYFQCYFDKNGQVTAFYRNCPWGQFWNQEILSCQPPKNVKCENDKCLGNGVKSYGDKSSCRSYWTCQGYSTPMCCPKGNRFVSDVGCVPDNTCLDDCLFEKVVTNSACDKRGIPSRPSSFEQYVTGYGWVHMECASGTRYSSAECSCSLVAHKKELPNKCSSLMYLAFDEGVRDTSGNEVFVQNEKVEIKGGLAYFNGSARLVIPQFTNAELGVNFGFRIRFKETKDYPRYMSRQSLINNGDCGDLGSVRLTLDEYNVNFGLKTEGEEEAIAFPIQKPLAEWTEVVYYVSDNMLDGWVNGVTNSRGATGPIEKRKCALQIGHGEGFSNFFGIIDEVELFRCDTGVWNHKTSELPQQGLTLPLPQPTRTITAIQPEQTTTASHGGVFITMPTEMATTTRSPTYSTVINNDVSISITPRYEHTTTTHQKTTYKQIPTVATLPPIIPQTLPPITFPVTSTLWTPMETTSTRPTSTTVDYWRTMPPIKPATFFPLPDLTPIVPFTTTLSATQTTTPTFPRTETTSPPPKPTTPLPKATSSMPTPTMPPPTQIATFPPTGTTTLPPTQTSNLPPTQTETLPPTQTTTDKAVTNSPQPATFMTTHRSNTKTTEKAILDMTTRTPVKSTMNALSTRNVGKSTTMFPNHDKTTDSDTSTVSTTFQTINHGDSLTTKNPATPGPNLTVTTTHTKTITPFTEKTAYSSTAAYTTSEQFPTTTEIFWSTITDQQTTAKSTTNVPSTSTSATTKSTTNVPSTTVSATTKSTTNVPSTSTSATTKSTTNVPSTTVSATTKSTTNVPSTTTSATTKSTTNVPSTTTSATTKSTTNVPSTTVSATTKSTTNVPSTTVSATTKSTTNVPSTTVSATTKSTTNVPSTTTSATTKSTTDVPSTTVSATTKSTTNVPSTTAKIVTTTVLPTRKVAPDPAR